MPKQEFFKYRSSAAITQDELVARYEQTAVSLANKNLQAHFVDALNYVTYGKISVKIQATAYGYMVGLTPQNMAQCPTGIAINIKTPSYIDTVSLLAELFRNGIRYNDIALYFAGVNNQPDDSVAF